LSPLELWRETIAALLAPRRFFPISLVCVPLIVAQNHFSSGHMDATALAALMCVFFISVAPWSWRALFPPDRPHPFLPFRIFAYAFLGGAPAFLGFALPEMLKMEATFLTGTVNLLVAATLFWVGGWGLARDIELEKEIGTQTARAEAMTREAERAQLLAVRAHLDPHFLFNTLNAIAEWCREDGEVAERAVLQLSAILREILGGISAPAWPLAQELALARDVWSLHRTRDPSWFTVDWQVPEPIPEVDLPPMLLLPIVENAVKHGPARGHHGVLSLRIDVRDDALEIKISNPGPYGGPREGGHGLGTVKKRISLSYAGRGSLKIGPIDDRTEVAITLPASGPETLT